LITFLCSAVARVSIEVSAFDGTGLDDLNMEVHDLMLEAVGARDLNVHI
jgi:hypothetical protein